jgi:hypothetical protein
MFSGIQELLILVIIILAIFFLPRIMAKDQNQKASFPVLIAPVLRLSGRLRLAILISLLWLLLSAAYYQPWQASFLPFLYAGVGPLIAGWGTFWVILGFKKYRR